MKTKPIRSKEFHSKLAAYSATATAALLAAPAAADAQGAIQNITSISPATTLGWSAGVGSVHQSFTAGPFQGLMQARDTITSTRAVRNDLPYLGGRNGGIACAGSLVNLFLIGASIRAGASHFNEAILAQKNPGYTKGSFQPPAHGAATGYVGFKAVHNAHTYYGWLRVSVSGDANGYPDEISLIAKAGEPGIYGAYGLASSDITAGEIASAVPEPSLAALGGLGLLALGARGVWELRRRRKNPIAA